MSKFVSIILNSAIVAGILAEPSNRTGELGWFGNFFAFTMVGVVIWMVCEFIGAAYEESVKEKVSAES